MKRRFYCALGMAVLVAPSVRAESACSPCGRVVVKSSPAACCVATEPSTSQEVVSGCGTPSSCGSISSSYAEDQPSELNILLTTELVALREEVKQLREAEVARAEALKEAEMTLTSEKSKLEKVLADLLTETKRAETAEAALKQSQTAMTDAKKASDEAVAKLNAQLAEADKKAKQAAGERDKLKKQVADFEKQAADTKKKQEEEKKRAEEAAAKREEEANAAADALEPKDDAAPPKPTEKPAEPAAAPAEPAAEAKPAEAPAEAPKPAEEAK